MKKFVAISVLLLTFLIGAIHERRIVAEWEPALGTMIRWPLGIPSQLVVELAEDDIIYVLVETNNHQNQAINTFTNWGINFENVVFINTDTYSHWTRDHGPQFAIGNNYWKVINQQFNGYPVEDGCSVVDSDCNSEMILTDCLGTEFCNDQPEYASDGYDCYVNNALCEDFNGDGQILDWLGDGYCDDGSWGLNFLCDEYSWDCGDCGEIISDNNSYCDNNRIEINRKVSTGRPLPHQNRGWDEDDDTNIDFANQLDWEILNIPIYWTGGNFMTDGYGTGFSTELMVNENNMEANAFYNIVHEYLDFETYHILDNPNEESIQHIDCLAKLVNPETIIIKQVSESSPEYECMEEFAHSFYELTTYNDRPYSIYRIYCPEINGGPWETNPVAAYTNSLILNQKVLVPQYGIPEDSEALNVYREAMPGYEIIGFDDTIGDPWYAEDALHCRTMGVFDPEMIHIEHKPIRSEEVMNNNIIHLTAEVIDYSNFDSELYSVTLNWKYSINDGPFIEIVLEFTGNNRYAGSFPLLNANSLIEYYITATSSTGKSISHPIAGWHTFSTSNSSLGDLNGDGLINIQDIILSVNIILYGEYNTLADLNSDGTIDVLDIILLINIILNHININ